MKLIMNRLVPATVALAVFIMNSTLAESLSIHAPKVLPRNQPLGDYSPLVSFTYSDLKEEPYTLRVWVLEDAGWNCASSQWCEKTFAINGEESGNGSLQMTSSFDVFDYPSLMWVARLFDRSGVEVASARAQAKTVAADFPVLKPIGKRVGAVGTEMRLVFSAKAPADDHIIYRLQNAPADAKLNAETGVFTWTPSSSGLHRIVVEAVSLKTKLTDAEIVSLDIGEAEEISGLK